MFLLEDPVCSTVSTMFSKAKSFVIDQHMAETKTDMKSSYSPQFKPSLILDNQALEIEK